MNYDNVKKGIPILFSAIILELISEILDGGITFFNSFATGEKAYIGIILSSCAIVFAILAFIQSMRACLIAGKDEKRFEFAVIFLIITMVFTAMIFYLNITQSASTSATFCVVVECATVFLICDAISKVYQQKGNTVRSKQGIATGIFFVTVFGMNEAILEMANDTPIYSGQMNKEVMVIISQILVLASFFCLIWYANKARKEL